MTRLILTLSISTLSVYLTSLAVPLLALTVIGPILAVLTATATWFTSDTIVSLATTTFITLHSGLNPHTTLILCFLYTVTLAVLLYSTWYLGREVRGSCLLLAFATSMGTLVIASDVVTLFIGWEGIGITSVLLIGLLSLRTTSLRAAMKAAVYNRLGDIALVLGVCIYLCTDSRLELLAAILDMEVHTLVCGLILISALCKSSQLGYHAWLLDAMEGPTPVSALLHSATLVLAGIVLLDKTLPMWYCSDIALMALMISCTTMLAASALACFSVDTKRLTALSTITHMSIGLTGLVLYSTSGDHSFTHAFTKACVFILLGYYLHTYSAQDTRTLSGSLTLTQRFLSLSASLSLTVPLIITLYCIATLDVATLTAFLLDVSVYLGPDACYILTEIFIPLLLASMIQYLTLLYREVVLLCTYVSSLPFACKLQLVTVVALALYCILFYHGVDLIDLLTGIYTSLDFNAIILVYQLVIAYLIPICLCMCHHLVRTIRHLIAIVQDTQLYRDLVVTVPCLSILLVVYLDSGSLLLCMILLLLYATCALLLAQLGYDLRLPSLNGMDQHLGSLFGTYGLALLDQCLAYGVSSSFLSVLLVILLVYALAFLGTSSMVIVLR